MLRTMRPAEHVGYPSAITYRNAEKAQKDRANEHRSLHGLERQLEARFGFNEDAVPAARSGLAGEVRGH